jgi:hypothetical protein
MYRNKVRSSRIKPLRKNILGTKYHIFVILIAFAITGGVIRLLSTEAAVLWAEYPFHAARCVGITPSRTVVLPGQVFDARVSVQNVGQSVFANGFGMALSEFTNGAAVWSATGTDLPSPGRFENGQTAVFNLRVTAPRTPGTYSFNWGLAIVFTGYIRDPCYGPQISVTNAPNVTFLANNSSGAITVNKGSSLTLSWKNNDAIIASTSCTASGSWSGAKGISGTENRTGDTAVAGTRTYTLTCANGTTPATLTRTVNVVNPPTTTTPTNPTTPTRPTSPTPPRTSPTPPRPTTPNNNPGNPGNSPAVIPVPTIPQKFSAKIVENSSVELSWTKDENDIYVTGYELERSIDQKSWEKLNKELITDEVYSDTKVKFETTYYYRLRSVNENNVKSDFVSTEVTTGKFESNTSAEGTELTSEDQKVVVFIPKDAIDGEALCSLTNNSDILAPTKESFETVAGPYLILCKKEDGTNLTSFKSPVTINVQTEEGAFKTLAFYGYSSDWEEVEGENTESSGKFQLTDKTSFAILGQKKSMSIFLKLFIALLVLGGTIFGGLVLVNIILRKKEERAIRQRTDDYYNKEHGY